MGQPLAAEPRLMVPFQRPIDADVRVPGSKSLTNRALVCAALSVGTTQLTGALRADDTDAMIECLRVLGVHITPSVDGTVLDVVGSEGHLAPGPVTLDARLSGTTSRFVAPLLVLGSGTYVLDAAAPMRHRPMADLAQALEDLGVVVDTAPGGHLPFAVVGGGATTGSVKVPGAVSSQFLSGLLLMAPCLPHGLTVEVVGPLISRPYVDMTVAVMREFGALVEEPSPARFVIAGTGYRSPGHFAIEPDASAASYFLGAAAITGGSVRIAGLGSGSTQGDIRFANILSRMGATVRMDEAEIDMRADGPLHGVTVDMADCSDTAQTLAVVAVFAEGPTRVTGIGFIRNKETNRIAAVVTELHRCGIEAEEEPDGFVVYPGLPQPTTFDTYGDHRMAMSFALLGLRAPGIAIADPRVVDKTFPGFFDELSKLRRDGEIQERP